MKHSSLNLLLGFLIFAIPTFAQQKIEAKDDKTKVKTENNVSMGEMKMKIIPPLDTAIIERVLGVKGKALNGEYKVTIPQNDLNIIVDGFKIIPAMGCVIAVSMRKF